MAVLSSRSGFFSGKQAHSLHELVPFRICPFKPLQHVGLVKHDAVELVPQRHPVGLNVVRPTKQFQLPRSGREALDDAVDLVRFVRGRPHLGNDDVTVKAAVQLEVALLADEAGLLAVVEPVAGSTCADNALQLVRLHPDQLVHALVPPQLEALASELHCAASHPQED
jgi:hypothetical protein